jgi:ATP-dependent protease Clp ATPase subunit
MLEVMFEIPSRSDIEEVVITRETVLERKPPIFVLRRTAGRASQSTGQAREA